MNAFPLPSFDQPDLARAVEALPPEALDRLPFGVIRLDEAGVVRAYSAAERRLSGSGERPRLGLGFDRAPGRGVAASIPGWSEEVRPPRLAD